MQPKLHLTCRWACLGAVYLLTWGAGGWDASGQTTDSASLYGQRIVIETNASAYLINAVQSELAHWLNEMSGASFVVVSNNQLSAGALDQVQGIFLQLALFGAV